MVRQRRGQKDQEQVAIGWTDTKKTTKAGISKMFRRPGGATIVNATAANGGANQAPNMSMQPIEEASYSMPKWNS